MLPQLNPLQCALTKFACATPLEYALAELLNLKSFRLRTYKKTGGRGAFPLNSRRAGQVIPRSDFFPAPEARGLQNHKGTRGSGPPAREQTGVLASHQWALRGTAKGQRNDSPLIVSGEILRPDASGLRMTTKSRE